MWPKTKAIPGRDFREYRCDFRPLIDSVVNIRISKQRMCIRINAHGDRFDSLDAGFQLFYSDGSAAFPELGLIGSKFFCGLSFESLARFSHLQTALIKVCLESERGRQMISSNPCLLWILVDFAVREDLRSSQIFDWLGLKRKRMISYLLGSNVDGDEQFISKISLFAGDAVELDLLKKMVLAPNVVPAYMNWPSVPIQVLYITKRYPSWHGSLFLLDWCLKEHKTLLDYLTGFHEVYRLAEDTVRLGQELNIKSAREAARATATVQNLKELHDSWVILVNKSRTFHNPDVHFAKPDLTEKEGITFIGSANKLIREGIEMQHCAATYVDKALKGESLMFAVSYPERATLEVAHIGDRYLVIEIKKVRNEPVSSHTLEYVQDWLASQQRLN